MPANRKISISLISSLSGYLAIVILCLSMTISVILCQHHFSPFDLWIENYGMANYNLNGAAFYDAGIIVTGALLCIFMLGFHKWYTDSRLYNTFLIAGQIFGILAAIILMLEGYTLFFEHMDPFVWSALFYIAVLISMISVTVGTMMRSGQHEDTICVGVTSIALIFLLAVTLYLNVAPAITEWFAALSILIWVALASRDMHKLTVQK